VEQKNTSPHNMLRAWENLSPLTVLGKDFDYEKPVISSLQSSTTAFGEYYAACYNYFIEYIQSQVYLSPYFHVSINGPNIHVTISESHKKINERAAPVYKLQDVYFRDKNKQTAYPIGLLPFQKGRQYSSIQYVSGYPSYLLSRIYGRTINKSIDLKFLPPGNKTDMSDLEDKFHKHKWGISVYCSIEKYKGVGLAKYKPGEIKSYDTSNSTVSKDLSISDSFLDLKIVDHLCSICYNTLSSAANDKSVEAEKILTEEQLLTSFFNYYQNRCPAPSKKQKQEGDSSHIFVGKKEECENCGASKETLFKRNVAYFNKYRDVFRGEQKERKVTFNNSFVKSPVMNIAVPKPIQEWKFNLNVINEISSKTHDFVTPQLKKSAYHNIWQNLGMVENSDYDQILSGSDNPSSRLDHLLVEMRINHVDMYIKELLYDYYTLINYKNLAIPPLEIKTVLDAAGSNDIEKLAKLPTLPGDTYFAVLEEIRFLYDKPGEEAHMAEFLLEYLIRNILFVYTNISNIVSKKLGNAFVAYFIGKIIKVEKTSSKLKDQKAAAIEASQVVDSPLDVNESNMKDNEQSRSFDGLVPADQVDKFSYDEMDYNGENETERET